MTTPTGGAPEGHNAAMEQRFDAGAAAAAAGTGYVAPAAPVVPAVAAPVVPPAAPEGAPAPAAPAAPAAPVAAPAAPAAPVAAPAAGTEGFIDGLLKDTGLTRDGLTAEFVAGGLTDDSYAKLAAKGIDKAAVDQFLGGVSAQVSAATAAYEAEVMAPVGSPEKYTELVNWAKDSLSAAEIQAFNDAVNSGNAKMAAFAVSGLNARFTVANPAEPSLINKGAPAGGVSGYESWAQVTKDMRDPQYAKDPAYRAKITERLRLSPGLV